MRKGEQRMPRTARRVEKAYRNVEFLNSPDARVIRLIAEFLEPRRRFRRENVRDTIVFFGSARVVSRRQSLARVKELERRLKGAKQPGSSLRRALATARTQLLMSKYYEDAARLSRMLTKWSMKLYQQNRFVVCSGGGPGIMEAANKGAKLAGGRSVGLNISLPYEQSANPYLTKNLNFEFHYFFMRKFWFVYLAKALVMFPGGFGTMDELFEVLTLLQTNKIKKKVTVVLYGREYWEKTLNFPNLIKLGLIGRKELKLFAYADTPEEAFEHLVKELRRNYPKETTEPAA
jgi:uncharacterized protein (TIGR00730 family)